MTDTTEDQSVTLARFPRRNRETGNAEQLRVEASEFNGRTYTHFRIWYQARRATPEDDGYRPSKIGVAVREGELDEVIRALEEARRIVQEQGRSTSPSAKQGPPTRAQRGPEQPGWRKLHNPPRSGATSMPRHGSRPEPTRQAEPEPSGDFDEF